MKSIMATIENFINPFTCGSNHLLSLASGEIAPDGVQNELLSIYEHGEAALSTFISDRLQGQTDLFSPIKAMKLKTFDSSTKPKKSKLQVKAQVDKQDKSLLSRLLILAPTRDVDIKEVLKHPLHDYPPSLAMIDGTLRKTNKSALLPLIESEDGASASTPAHPTALIVDAMAIIQAFSMSKLPKTFGEFSTTLLIQVSSMAKTHGCCRVDFVIDRYLTSSIKNAERDRRSSSHIQRISVTREDQKIPKQWKGFLSCGENKESLLKFIATHWPKQKLILDEALIVVMTTGCSVSRLRYEPDSLPLVASMPSLESDHEEADTRLILHAVEASTHSKTVIIYTPDTDVIVIAIGHVERFTDSLLLVLTGTGQRKRFININACASRLENMSQSLIGLHAFSGCDTVSSLKGKGKKTVFNLTKNSETLQIMFSKLGKDFNLSEELFHELCGFTCLVFGLESSSDLNSARYSAFCANRDLPPTYGQLKQHANRANYQAAIWKRACLSHISPPTPTDSGWVKDGEDLRILWTEEEIAPPDILKSTFCRCKTNCSTERCSCRKSRLICTDLCACQDCINAMEDSTEEDSDPE